MSPRSRRWRCSTLAISKSMLSLTCCDFFSFLMLLFLLHLLLLLSVKMCCLMFLLFLFSMLWLMFVIGCLVLCLKHRCCCVSFFWCCYCCPFAVWRQWCWCDGCLYLCCYGCLYLCCCDAVWCCCSCCCSCCDPTWRTARREKCRCSTRCASSLVRALCATLMLRPFSYCGYSSRWWCRHRLLIDVVLDEEAVQEIDHELEDDHDVLLYFSRSELQVHDVAKANTMKLMVLRVEWFWETWQCWTRWCRMRRWRWNWWSRSCLWRVWCRINCWWRCREIANVELHVHDDLEVSNAVPDDQDETVDVEKGRDEYLDDNVQDEVLNDVDWIQRTDDKDEVAVLDNHQNAMSLLIPMQPTQGGPCDSKWDCRGKFDSTCWRWKGCNRKSGKWNDVVKHRIIRIFDGRSCSRWCTWKKCSTGCAKVWMRGPLGVFKKFVQTKKCAHFSARN